jgi:hypothetical protein
LEGVPAEEAEPAKPQAQPE